MVGISQCRPQVLGDIIAATINAGSVSQEVGMVRGIAPPIRYVLYAPSIVDVVRAPPTPIYH